MSTKCWNFGSVNYKDVAALEERPDCGIRCCYRGGGANNAYNRASDAMHDEVKDRNKEKLDEWYRQAYGEDG